MFIKSALLLALCSFPLMAAEENLVMPWQSYKDFKCQKEFNKLSVADSFQNEKFRQQVGSFNSTVYRNLSSVIGKWTEVHMIEKSSPVVYTIKDTLLEKKSFDEKCNVVTKAEAWPVEMDKVLSFKTKDDWNNYDLQKQISSGKPGLIYFWSPKFAYSVYDMPRVEKLAQAYGYEFIAVVDPRASKKEVQGAMKVLQKSLKDNADRKLASASNFSRNISTDLYMRSGFNHFPVTYVYNNHKIHSRWITGIMTDEGLKSMASEFSAELK